jgi:hypothetical protein
VPDRTPHDILDAVRLRLLSAAAVLTLAATALSGCRSNVGVAATVNGHRISESTVSDYVTEQGPTAKGRAQAAAQNTTPSPPKSIVLQYLVQERVFEEALRVNGGVPTDPQLTQRHDEATQLFLQNPGGTAFDRTLEQALPDSGIHPSFARLYIRTLELEDVLVQKLRASSLAELAAAVDKAGVAVRVDPRYGSWRASSLSIDSSGSAGLPDYLDLQPTPGAVADQPGLSGQ